MSELTPRERLNSALSMEIPDRIPLFYQHLGGAKWVVAASGKTIRESYRDPEAFATNAMMAQKLFGFDNVMASWGDILIEAQAHGTRIKFPERDFYPRPDRYAIDGPQDVDKIHPIDPMENELWSVQLKAARIMNTRIGKEIAVVGCIDSPIVIASEIIGSEKLMMALITAPSAMEKLLQTVTESSKMYAERISQDIGLETIFIEDGMAGGDMVRLNTCQKFDLSYMKQMIDHCHKLGLKVIVHNCSGKPYVDAQVDLKPDCIHFNNKMVDLSATFRNLKGKVCVMSGIDHMELLFTGSPTEVQAEVEKVIDLFGKESGLILAPGCELPYKTPTANIASFKKTVETFGKY
jgi:uroporphyrinogen decarboxylase